MRKIVTDSRLTREEVFCAKIFDGRQYTERELAILGGYEKEELNIMPRFSICTDEDIETWQGTPWNIFQYEGRDYREVGMREIRVM